MARRIGEAFVAVRPEIEPGFGGRIAAGAGAGGRRAGTAFGSGFRSTFVPLAKTIGALFVGREVVDFFKGVVSEATEAKTVTAQTNAVLLSTAGAAHISAKAVGDLATAISNKVGVDDEAIQSSENLLLTFRNVRNQVGKGNNVFDQATTAIVDMTAAMNHGVVTTDNLKSTSIQVGKALNDPIKGLTALSRVGVTFTQGQKDQIKALVASGHTLAAQKIILAELNKEFQGSAAAVATPAAKMNVAWKNLQETIGGLVLPILGRLMTFTGGLVNQVSAFVSSPKVAAFGHTLATGIGAAVDAAKKFVTSFDWSPAIRLAKALWTVITQDIVPALVGLYRTYGPAVATALGAVFSAVGTLAPVLTGLGAALKAVFGFIADNKATVAAFAGVILLVVGAIKVWRAVTLVMTAVQTALDVALDANPIGIVVVAIAALVAAIVWVATKTRFFQTVWSGLWGFLKAVGHWFAHDFVDFFKSAWHAIQDSAAAAARFFIGIFKHINDVVMAVFGVIIHGAASAFGWVPGIGSKLRDAAAKFDQFRDRINRTLSGILDQSATVRVHVEFPGIAPRAANQIRAGLTAGIRFRQHGGPIPPYGWSWVGERGAELIRAGSSGATVASHGTSMGMTRGAGGADVHFHFHGSVIASKRQAEDLIFEAYTNLVRARRIRPVAAV